MTDIHHRIGVESSTDNVSAALATIDELPQRSGHPPRGRPTGIVAGTPRETVMKDESTKLGGPVAGDSKAPSLPAAVGTRTPGPPPGWVRHAADPRPGLFR
jgi:hypothetical protein